MNTASTPKRESWVLRSPSDRDRHLQIDFLSDSVVNLTVHAPRVESRATFVDRGELLAALGAEPDETDYQEVLKENDSLGRRLWKAIDERDDARERSADLLERARVAEQQRDTWEERARTMEGARDYWVRQTQQTAAAKQAAGTGYLAQQAPEPEEDHSDDPQIDRSWALDKASEVIARLASVGISLSDPERALEWAAEWILAGKAADRG